MLDKEYIKALRGIRLYNYTLLDKPYTKNIEISIDKLKVSCDSLRVGGILLNGPKGVENIINIITAMTVEHIKKVFSIPIYDEYKELAETRIWSLQHTVDYKRIIYKLFEYAMKGNAKKVEYSLEELQKYIHDMLEDNWIVK